MMWNFWTTYIWYFLDNVQVHSGEASFADMAESFGDLFGALEQCHYTCDNGERLRQQMNEGIA